MKRNTIVTGITLSILAIFAWAGWANWEYRKQATERRLAHDAHAELVPAAAAGNDDPMLSSSKLVGHPAPDFTLENLAGQKVSLSSFKGKALLINFWATWCGPCKLETPWLVELRNKYAAQGFEVIGIDAEDDEVKPSDAAAWAKDKAAVQKFVQEEHISYPVLLGGDDLSHPYGGLDAMPTSFYVDRSGKVVAMRMGISSKDDMEARIQQALGAAQ